MPTLKGWRGHHVSRCLLPASLLVLVGGVDELVLHLRFLFLLPFIFFALGLAFALLVLLSSVLASLLLLSFFQSLLSVELPLINFRLLDPRRRL